MCARSGVLQPPRDWNQVVRALWWLKRATAVGSVPVAERLLFGVAFPRR